MIDRTFYMETNESHFVWKKKMISAYYKDYWLVCYY